MSLTVDPETASPDSIRDVMAGCLEGDDDAVKAPRCEGPLVGAMGGYGTATRWFHLTRWPARRRLRA